MALGGHYSTRGKRVQLCVYSSNRKRTPVIFFIDGRGAVVAKGSTAREGAR